MKRSALETLHLKKKTKQTLLAYKKQKNYCSRLYKKERKAFFNNLDPTFVLDNKMFWKNITSFFSDKRRNNNRIILKDEEGVILDEENICEEFNSYFIKATESLNCDGNSLLINKTSNFDDPIENIIQKFEVHPSILLIRNKVIEQSDTKFSSSEIRFSEVEK